MFAQGKSSTVTIIFDLSSINLAQIVHFIYICIYRLWPGLWFATIVDPKASLPPKLEPKKYDMRFKFYIAKHLFNENIPSIRPLCPVFVLCKIKPYLIFFISTNTPLFTPKIGNVMYVMYVMYVMHVMYVMYAMYVIYLVI